ncbi:class I SAM-dependent methyltransferase [Marinactinospora rubrisoli]|uniref:Class I SAM-dependent methyltransferase n=1 Tax=Marinactinospora rubrisoli TaxID=2715399 RepID=A0ABW2KII7_9ACTN
MADHYEASAEFIDMMIAPWWEQAGGVLTGALAGLDPAAGPIVDAGAGSGRGLALIDRAVPGADLLAVEPSPGMRAALFARLLPDERLRSRVTVLPCGLLDARLPDRLGAVVALNVIGHFPPADRQRLWETAARRLSPQGRVVLNLSPPHEPVRIPPARMADVRLGWHAYEGWAEAEPSGEGRLTWRMTYRVLDGARTVSEAVVEYDWWLLTEDGLRAETAAHGLAAEPHGPRETGCYIVRPAATG